jgi:two-component system sensor histidine kinase YesM
MKSAASFIGNMKLRNKLILGYILIALLPSGLTLFFMLDGMIRSVAENNYHINEITFRQIKETIEAELIQNTTVTDNIAGERLTRRYLTKSYISEDGAGGDAMVEKYTDYREFTSLYRNMFNMMSHEPVSVRFYSSNPEILKDFNLISPLTDEIIATGWYSRVMEREGVKVVIDPYINSRGEAVFAMSYKLIYDIAPGLINVLYIEIKESSVYRYINNEAENKEIYVINANGKVVSSTDRGAFGKDASEIGALSVDRGNFRERLYFSDNLSPYGLLNGWSIVTIVPNDALNAEIGRIIANGLLVTAIVFIVSIAIIVFFANTITKRTRALMKNMSDFKEGNMEIEIKTDYRDEIGNISKGLKDMTERINLLINDVYIAEMNAKNLTIERNREEIHALQSQINPHFIFNTMEAIRMNLLIKKDTETAGIVEAYASLVRESINWRADVISLREEMAFIKDFLLIQKFRFRDKMDYKITVDETLLDYSILKFAIQPIVENSFNHGIEKKESAGTVEINIARDGEQMLIEVKDDGVGMTEGELSNIRETMFTENADSGRVGLRSVARRLHLFYNGKSSVTIDSAAGKGTTVTIRLPLQKR